MERDTVINKVMFELIERKAVSIEASNILRMYFEQVYGCGFNYGRTLRPNKRTVISLDSNGQRVAEYESVAQTARSLGVSIKTVEKVLSPSNSNTKTKGLFLKYKTVK